MPFEAVLASSSVWLHRSARTGKVPILLLDDVGSELDPERSRRFFDLLSELGGQVFLTTTRRDLIQVAGERADYAVRGGQVERA